jgi:hypothetical protein
MTRHFLVLPRHKSCILLYTLWVCNGHKEAHSRFVMDTRRHISASNMPPYVHYTQSMHNRTQDLGLKTTNVFLSCPYRCCWTCSTYLAEFVIPMSQIAIKLAHVVVRMRVVHSHIVQCIASESMVFVEEGCSDFLRFRHYKKSSITMSRSHVQICWNLCRIQLPA